MPWDTIAVVAAALIALGALGASLVAVGVSVWEGTQSRRHHRLSVVPSLKLQVSCPPQTDLIFRIENALIFSKNLL